MTRRNLLINAVFQPPVGHVIEALRWASDFKAADPEVDVTVLLNSLSPVELASCAPAVSAVHAVNVAKAADPAGFPPDLERSWDYVFTDPRAATVTSKDLLLFHEAFRQWVQAGQVNDGWISHPPRIYRPLRLQLPEHARDAAKLRLGAGRSPRICALLGGGSYFRAPSLIFWTTLFDAFFGRWPDGEVVLLGALAPGRTTTRGISRADVEGLLQRFPRMIDGFDLGILVQLALAEQCKAHVSPHTGMAFAIQAVGVPWLALSGQEWHEYLLNGVPLIAVYPECPLYPCFRKMYPECGSVRQAGLRTPCIDDDALLRRMPEIMEGIDTLISGRLPYHDAARRHEAALRARLGPESWTIVEWPHVVADDYEF